eukprot:10745343-Ditylum_brightwellii.AAC.1
MAMKHWVVVSKSFIQYCLGLIQRQRKNKMADIRKYIHTTKITNIPKDNTKKNPNSGQNGLRRTLRKGKIYKNME